MIEKGYISVSKKGEKTLWLDEKEEWAPRSKRAVHEKISFADQQKAHPDWDISFIPSSEG